jgi:hypothetical protein
VGYIFLIAEREGQEGASAHLINQLERQRSTRGLFFFVGRTPVPSQGVLRNFFSSARVYILQRSDESFGMKFNIFHIEDSWES